MFSLLVGPEKMEMMVHETILSKSPVLARACNGSFVEASEQLIKLAEDDPFHIACVVDYLQW